MSYYTRFELALINTDGDPLTPTVAERLAIGSRLDDLAGYGKEWDADGDLFYGEPVKWYGFESDIKCLSADFPDFVFALHGDGEEKGDQWVYYARRGCGYEQKMPAWTPPPPDMTRLR